MVGLEMRLILGILMLVTIPITIVQPSQTATYSEPDYIKELVAYQEGPGVVVYFILADENGRMIAADGRYVLSIYKREYGLVYMEGKNVTRSDFEKFKVGMGPFEREVLGYVIGRIKFKDFEVQPNDGDYLDIVLEFITVSGNILSEDTWIYVS